MPPIGPDLPTTAQTEPLPNTETFVLKGHDGPVLAVRFNKLGTYCLSGGRVCTLKPPSPSRNTCLSCQTHLHRSK